MLASSLAERGQLADIGVRAGIRALLRQRLRATASARASSIRRFSRTRAAPPSRSRPTRRSVSISLARTSLRLAHYEDITPHSAETLRLWRERFEPRACRAARSPRSLPAQVGVLSRLLRGAFRERSNVTAQLVFENGATRRGALSGELALAAEEIA